MCWIYVHHRITIGVGIPIPSITYGVLIYKPADQRVVVSGAHVYQTVTVSLHAKKAAKFKRCVVIVFLINNGSVRRIFVFLDHCFIFIGQGGGVANMVKMIINDSWSQLSHRNLIVGLGGPQPWTACSDYLHEIEYNFGSKSRLKFGVDVVWSMLELFIT